MTSQKTPPRTDSQGHTFEQIRVENPRQHTHGLHNWPDWVNLTLGIWLFFAPMFSIGAMTATAAGHHYIAGAAVALISLVALIRPRQWQEWINLAVGVWVFLAPFLLGFWDIGWALWNHLIAGVLVISLATYALVQQRRLRVATR